MATTIIVAIVVVLVVVVVVRGAEMRKLREARMSFGPLKRPDLGATYVRCVVVCLGPSTWPSRLLCKH